MLSKSVIGPPPIMDVNMDGLLNFLQFLQKYILYKKPPLDYPLHWHYYAFFWLSNDITIFKTTGFRVRHTIGHKLNPVLYYFYIRKLAKK